MDPRGLASSEASTLRRFLDSSLLSFNQHAQKLTHPQERERWPKKRAFRRRFFGESLQRVSPKNERTKERTADSSPLSLFSSSFQRGVLDRVYSVREPLVILKRRYGVDENSLHALPPDLQATSNWQAILRISLVSKKFRDLCIGRIFGTIFRSKIEKIGKLWKLLETNPRLLTSTHTICADWKCELYESKLTPFDAMSRAFTSRLNCVEDKVTDVQRELDSKRRKRSLLRGELLPEVLEEEDYESDLDSQLTSDYESRIWSLKNEFATEGPDGKGMDEIVTNPAILEDALKDVFSSSTRLKHLHWTSSYVPTFTSSINALVQLGSLESLKSVRKIT